MSGPGTPGPTPAGRGREQRVRVGAMELTKLGASRFDWRDPYHVALTLNWRQFGLAFVASDIAINVLFGALYALRPGCIANLSPGPITGAFFFSMETLAAVGYGVAAPVTLYGHSVAAVEMVVGMAFTAIITGLTFVRFSRPRAKLLYADRMVVAQHNGQPTLMLRVGYGRTGILTDASARIAVLLAERSTEGQYFRRTFDLRLLRPQIPILALTWTVMHVIDEDSPLSGYDRARLLADEARFFVTIEARDPLLASTVHDMKDFTGTDVMFGMRYADAISFDAAGQPTADLARVGLLEPEPSA